ncbi:class I SAM-dependent methyltransferase [Sediminibacterium roseum]|uniref:Class I SAM-dependent methyltransferase n=1 Tax=Sediminibacterium roseum TaxID=1978412 RepID=A0ABW9ZV05_9BACT|nr:methyltransferase domain-containing protein [Sediminibacterium roseum]NCI49572.1 class I SAM-dependent methyltransferase [Sediminibacterium roseum]
MSFPSKFERKVKGTLSRWFGITFQSRSETSKVRNWVLPYCEGHGCDVGFGGDKIKKTDCEGIDFPQPYTKTGTDKVDIGVDVINNEIPVADNTYDYVYTSHLIEDFVDTKDALRKFIRILKNGGNLILVFPDQPKYKAMCDAAGIPMNPYHIHADMGYDFMMKKINELEGISYDILFQSNCEIDYNVVIVLKIRKSA